MGRPLMMLVILGAWSLGTPVVGQTAGSGGSAAAAENVPAAMSAEPDFRRIVQEAKAKVWPAVVYIVCVRESLEGGRRETQQVTGSGVIITPEGEILTNWHVVDKAISVRCLLSDGRYADATVGGTDKDTDLALIRLSVDRGTEAWRNIPYASIGDSRRLREGDFVMAMGAPWGLNRSVSIGIVSCVSRYLDGQSQYNLWIQTDAAINPGNSGGPLVNTAGEIVGINTLGMSFSADGIGFAVPSETVEVVLPQLREAGRVNWSWTGLQLQPLRDFNRDQFFDATEGVIVAETDPDSPARRAGIRARDRIVRVGETPVTAMTSEDLPAVRRMLGLLAKDREVVMDVVRGEERLSLPLTPREKGSVEGDQLALERFDFTVRSINQFDNPGLFFHRQQGVFVFGVRQPGNAVRSGLVPQDIILRIDGQEVVTLDDVRRIHAELLAGVERRSRVTIVVLRGGLLRQFVLDFSRDFQRE